MKKLPVSVVSLIMAFVVPLNAVAAGVSFAPAQVEEPLPVVSDAPEEDAPEETGPTVPDEPGEPDVPGPALTEPPPPAGDEAHAGAVITQEDEPDSGPFSTQAALQAYINGTTGNITAKVAAGFALDTQLYIQHPRTVTLESAGVTPAVLSRGPGLLADMVSVSSESTLVLQNITLDGTPGQPGDAVTGRLVLNAGRLTIRDGATLQNNRNSNANGSGIFNGSNATLRMEGGVIRSNQNDYEYAYGGGVFNIGTFYMTGGLIGGSGEGDGNGGVVGGGGVCNYSGGTFVMSGGAIRGNSAVNGGGVYNERSADGTTIAFTLRGTAVIAQNHAVDTSGYDMGMGGGIYNVGICLIEGGTVGGSDAADANTADYGGGIANSGDGKLTMTAGSLRNNTASTEGGGICYSGAQALAISGGSIRDNTAPKGADVLMDRAVLNVSGSPVIGTADGGIYLKGTASGVAVAGPLDAACSVWFEGRGDHATDDTSRVMVTKANAVTQAEQDAFHIADPFYALALGEDGKTLILVGGASDYDLQGAIDIAAGGNAGAPVTVELTEDIIIDKTITIGSGASPRHILLKGGGTVLRSGSLIENSAAGYMFNIPAGSTLVLEDITIDGVKDIFSSTAMIYNQGTLAVGNGAVLQNNNASGYGGAIYNHGGSLTVRGTAQIKNNSASYGGAIDNRTYGVVTISGGTISGNSTDYRGGAINVQGATLAITGGTISGNSSVSGGGLYVTGNQSAVTITGGTITGNTATVQGGGVDHEGGTLTLRGITLDGNTSPEGSGAYVGSGATLLLGGGVKIGAATTGDSLFFYPGGKATIDATYPLTGAARVNVACNPNAAPGTIFAVRSDGAVISAAEKDRFFSVSGTGAAIESSADGKALLFKLSYPAGSLQYKVANASATATAENPALITLSGTTTLDERVFVAGGDGTPRHVKITGGAIIKRAAGHTGHLFNVPAGSTLVLENITVDGAKNIFGTSAMIYNQGTLAVGDGAVLQNNNASGYGGAIYNHGGSLTVRGTAQIKNNSASYGGAIDNRTYGVVSITGGTISGNSASSRGGAINVQGATLGITGGTISGNSSVSGGGLYATGSQSAVTITGGTITGNAASVQGGGIDQEGGTLTLRGITLDGNTSPYGSGIYSGSSTTLLLGGGVKIGAAATGDTLFLNTGGKAAIDAAYPLTSAARVNLQRNPDAQPAVPVVVRSDRASLADDFDKFTAVDAGSKLLLNGDKTGILLVPDITLTGLQKQVDEAASGTAEKPQTITLRGTTLIGEAIDLRSTLGEARHVKITGGTIKRGGGPHRLPVQCPGGQHPGAGKRHRRRRKGHLRHQRHDLQPGHADGGQRRGAAKQQRLGLRRRHL